MGLIFASKPKKKAEDDDPHGRYEIRYIPFNPCVRPDAPFTRTERTRVTGKNNMKTTRKALREFGAKLVSVRRTKWFS